MSSGLSGSIFFVVWISLVLQFMMVPRVCGSFIVNFDPVLARELRGIYYPQMLIAGNKTGQHLGTEIDQRL